ncbi:hypothetical protein C8R44DRAFT_815214 [Mycena epipterygia]|nr:hypothetical protein C8R44DRAFT_815214 [Mycena epipterygia]
MRISSLFRGSLRPYLRGREKRFYCRGPANLGIGFDIFNLESKHQNARTYLLAAHSQESGNFYLMDVVLSIITEVHVTTYLAEQHDCEGKDSPMQIMPI